FRRVLFRSPAEQGAVGVAEVVDLLGAQREPDPVHVPGGVLGAHVLQHRAVAVGAGGGVVGGPRRQGGLVAPGGGHGVRADRPEGAGDAADGGGALPGAAGVDAGRLVAAAHVAGEARRGRCTRHTPPSTGPPWSAPSPRRRPAPAAAAPPGRPRGPRWPASPTPYLS